MLGLKTNGELQTPEPGATERPDQLFHLEPRMRDAVVSRCHRATYQPGQSLFEQGARHTHSYIIEEGLVRTYYTASSGREITMAYWSEGDLVGGPNFFGDGYHTWSGTVQRTTRVLAIRGRDLKQLAHHHPEIAFWMTNTLMFKLRWVSILFQLHGTESVRERLCKLILMLADIYGVGDRGRVLIKHRINQSDLATLVGASRQWTNKILSELQTLGLLGLEDRHIIICDLAGLQALIDD
ncbi:MAG: Crp/Fnr family transcriptional regulator [Hyphomicrobiales bacterium]|nr:Crp/Fnr family transcriptional regulator [Hyphomicrobiales bacterium]